MLRPSLNPKYTISYQNTCSPTRINNLSESEGNDEEPFEDVDVNC